MSKWKIGDPVWAVTTVGTLAGVIVHGHHPTYKVETVKYGCCDINDTQLRSRADLDDVDLPDSQQESLEYRIVIRKEDGAYVRDMLNWATTHPGAEVDDAYLFFTANVGWTDRMQETPAGTPIEALPVVNNSWVWHVRVRGPRGSQEITLHFGFPLQARVAARVPGIARSKFLALMQQALDAQHSVTGYNYLIFEKLKGQPLKVTTYVYPGGDRQRRHVPLEFVDV